MRAIYPGSFDPVTYGHINIIERAAKFCDHLVIGVLENVNKKPLFTVEERTEMLKEAVKHLNNVEVKAFDGFAVGFAVQNDAEVMIRGVRGEKDFSYELELSQINRTLEPKVDTVFLSTDLPFSIISSSGAKEIAANGGDVTKFVPPAVADRLIEKLKNSRR